MRWGRTGREQSRGATTRLCGMKLFVCSVGQMAAELEWEEGGSAGAGDECKGIARWSGWGEKSGVCARLSASWTARGGCSRNRSQEVKQQQRLPLLLRGLARTSRLDGPTCRHNQRCTEPRPVDSIYRRIQADIHKATPPRSLQSHWRVWRFMCLSLCLPPGHRIEAASQRSHNLEARCTRRWAKARIPCAAATWDELVSGGCQAEARMGEWAETEQLRRTARHRLEPRRLFAPGQPAKKKKGLHSGAQSHRKTERARRRGQPGYPTCPSHDPLRSIEPTETIAILAPYRGGRIVHKRHSQRS